MEKLLDALTVIYKYKKLYEKQCQRLMKEYNLRVADLDILHYVAHSGQKNLSKDIVDYGMSKANVSKSVEHLRQIGLVELREDREDRRCVHIEPTAAAAEVIEEVAQVRRNMAQILGRNISGEDREALLRVMKQLNYNVSEELQKTASDTGNP